MRGQGFPLAKVDEVGIPGEKLDRFFRRMEDSVRSKLGAGQTIGEAYRPERWRREIEADFLEHPAFAAALAEALRRRLADVVTMADLSSAMVAIRSRTDSYVDLIGADGPASPHVVYSLFDKRGTLLYVGVTDRGPRRWVEHARSKSWFDAVSTFTIERHPTRAEALRIEALKIRQLAPLFNQVHNSGRAVPYASPHR